MAFKLNIKTDSDAFGKDLDKVQEIVRILKSITEAIECGWESDEIRDNNGHVIGIFKLD